MDIGSATFGYDASGKKEYLEQIRAKVIETAASDAKDIAAINDAVDANWKGTAAEQFKTALQKDTNEISTSLEELYTQLVNEINNIGNAIADFDNGLMSSLNQE